MLGERATVVRDHWWKPESPSAERSPQTSSKRQDDGLFLPRVSLVVPADVRYHQQAVPLEICLAPSRQYPFKLSNSFAELHLFLHRHRQVDESLPSAGWRPECQRKIQLETAVDQDDTTFDLLPDNLRLPRLTVHVKARDVALWGPDFFQAVESRNVHNLGPQEDDPRQRCRAVIDRGIKDHLAGHRSHRKKNVRQLPINEANCMRAARPVHMQNLRAPSWPRQGHGWEIQRLASELRMALPREPGDMSKR